MSQARRIAGILLLLASVAGCETTIGQTDRRPVRTGPGGAGFGEVSIRLTGVAEPLELPAAEGANRVLTASVKGAEVGSVWLAPSATSPLRVPLTKVDDGEYQVNLYGRDVYDLLKAQGPAGEFRVIAETPDGTAAESIAVRYHLRVVPGRLDLPWDKVTTRIYQRTTRELPGSHGNLRLHLGDITAGQVLLSVTGPNDEPVIAPTSVRQGDVIRLPLGEAQYVLVVDQLVNLLVGIDYGVFSLLGDDAWRQEEIERLLKAVEESDATFLRGAQEFTGPDFAAHLRLKLGWLSCRAVSVDQFIEQVGGRSWTTGEPYQVRLPDGQTVDATSWLLQQASAFRAIDETEPSNDPAVAPSEHGCSGRQ